MLSIPLRLCLTLLAFAALPAVAREVPIADFFRHSEFTDLQISPTGEFLTVSVPQDDRTILAVLRTADKSVVAKWDYGARMHVNSVQWVNDERFMVRVAEKKGAFDYMVGTPDMHFANADGSRRMSVPLGGTYALVDMLRKDERNILVQRTVERANLFKLDVYTGKMAKVAVSPVEYGTFAIDHDGKVRFAFGQTDDGKKAQTWRYNGTNDWTLFDEADALEGSLRQPVGFSADNSKVYFRSSSDGKPEGIVEYDIQNKQERELFRHEYVDVGGTIWNADDTELLGVMYEPGLPHKKYFDGDNASTQWMAGLDQAFPDHGVVITSMTSDGSKALLRIYSDVDPGQAYIYDTNTGKATFLLASRAWIKPAEMSKTKPVSVKTRDGLTIHGYLTIPNGSDGKNLPMIMHPHGGPHGPRDQWGFDPQVQFMANRGYAVLQMNYRGSGGYGAKFQSSGYRRWGHEMQDDLTDSVKWAVAQGIADPERICIAGASYGGYAALMNVVREPDLYKCTVGYVGVYSLPMMTKKGDIPDSDPGQTFLARILPENESEQRAQSPAYNIDKINIPVMLVQGAKDERVPIAQYDFLLKALTDAGKAPEITVVEDKEGHGFYKLENNVNLYTKMEAFFDKHIGKAVSGTVTVGDVHEKSAASQ